MAATTSTLSAVIKPVYEPGYSEGVFYNDGAFLSLFGAPVRNPGDTAFRWLVNSGSNDSVEAFSEGDPAPDPGNQSFVAAYVSYSTYWAWVQVSGHLRTAVESAYFPAIDAEFSLARNSLVDLITTTSMNTDLLTAVDSSTNYGGLTRSAATYFQSTETDLSSTALDSDDILDTMEAQMDNDKNGKPMVIVCPFNQSTNVYRLTGVPATQMISDRDKAPSYLSQAFATIPIRPFPDMTDTVIAILDTNPGNFVVVESRPFTINDAGRSGDSDVYELSAGVNLICKVPRKQAKIIGITA